MTHTTIYEIEITSSRTPANGTRGMRGRRAAAWLLIGAGIKLALVAVALLFMGGATPEAPANANTAQRH